MKGRTSYSQAACLALFLANMIAKVCQIFLVGSGMVQILNPSIIIQIAPTISVTQVGIQLFACVTSIYTSISFSAEGKWALVLISLNTSPKTVREWLE